MKQPTILIDTDGSSKSAYKFTFVTDNGKITGRVSVGITGAPDTRTPQQKVDAAQKKIAALADEFAKAAK